VGLGGTLSPGDVPVGSVVTATRFRQLGIGAGSEPQLSGIEELGLPAAATGALPLADVEEATPVGVARGVEMLSVCAASAALHQAERRAERFPLARVEEMEGFAVARAARLFGRRLACLRAIGNVAGQRDRRAWRGSEAMAALASVLRALG
jgi:nucleoside phosphorylase